MQMIKMRTGYDGFFLQSILSSQHPAVLPARHPVPLTLLTRKFMSTLVKYPFLDSLTLFFFFFLPQLLSALSVPQVNHPSIASSSAFSPALSVESQGSGTPVIMCRSPTGKPAILQTDTDSIQILLSTF